jgi:hypothetical protein
LLADLLIEGLMGAAPGGSIEDWRQRLAAVLEDVNRRVYEAGRGHREGLGAVLTLAIVDRLLIVATLGDSAGYLHRRGALAKVTCFDGGGSVTILEGTADAWISRFIRHDCIGLPEHTPMQGDLQGFEPRRGDLLLMCTRGAIIAPQRLSSGVLFAPPLGCPDEDPALVARTVVERRDDDGWDASCLVVRFSGSSLADPDPSEPRIPWREHSEGLPLYGGHVSFFEGDG